jgi:hypothetical protein
MNRIPVARGLLGATTWAASASSPAGKASGEGADDSSGPYVIVQDTWVYLIDESDAYLDRARDDLAHRNPKSAAANVRKAAALVKAESARAIDEDRKRLARDAEALLQVAQEIDRGKLVKADDLDQAVWLARLDLGIHHDLQAAESWARKDTREAGRSLSAATRYVAAAARSADAKVSADVRTALANAQRIGDRATQGVGNVVESDWMRAREDLHKAIRSLSKDADPGRAS